MASLFAQYKKEREGKEVLETDFGFASFEVRGEICYIEDIFIVSDKRQRGLASKLADQVSEFARKKGCKTLFGSVCPSAYGATVSLKALLSYGFELSHSDFKSNLIFLKKEL